MRELAGISLATLDVTTIHLAMPQDSDLRRHCFRRETLKPPPRLSVESRSVPSSGDQTPVGHEQRVVQQWQVFQRNLPSGTIDAGELIHALAERVD